MPMLFTVQVPDNQAAFFRKLIKSLSFSIKKTGKEARMAAEDNDIIESTRRGLLEYHDHQEGKQRLQTLDSFKTELLSGK